MDSLPYYDWNTGISIQPWAWLWDDEDEEEWEFIMDYQAHLHPMMSYEYESREPMTISLKRNKTLRNSEKMKNKDRKIVVIKNR